MALLTRSLAASFVRLSGGDWYKYDKPASTAGTFKKVIVPNRPGLVSRENINFDG